MKYWLSLALSPVEDHLTLARQAEQVGFEGLTLPDHVVLPDVVRSYYPGSPTGAFTVLPEAPFPSCWVAFAAMGAVTSSLRFATTVSVLTLRHPLVLARDVATAACYAPGRVVLGAGVGWMREEFDALGRPFDHRGRRTDEIIEICRSVWHHGAIEHRGTYYTIPKVHVQPRPPADVAIWIGGGSDAALHRAARLGDGFISEGHFDQAEALIGKLQSIRAETGTTSRHFELIISTVGRADGDWPSPDDVERMASLGVDGIKVKPWTRDDDKALTIDAKRAILDRFAAAYF